MALRREERPDEGYWKDFLCEFHQRQREEAVNKSGLMGVFEQAKAWFANLGPSKWAYGAGLAYAAVDLLRNYQVHLAYAAVTIGYLSFGLSRDAEMDYAPATPVKHEVLPGKNAPVEQLDHLDLSPSTQGTAGEQVF